MTLGNLIPVLEAIRWDKVLLVASMVAFFALVHFWGLAPAARRLKKARDLSARQSRLLEVNRPAERLANDLLLAIAGDGPSSEQLRSQITVLQTACPLVAEHVAYLEAVQHVIRQSAAFLGPGWSPSGLSRTAPVIGDLQRSHARLSHEFLLALAAIEAERER